MSQSIWEANSEARETAHGTRPVSRHLSIQPLSNDRGIVTAGKPTPPSPNHFVSHNSNLGLSVSVCIQLCQCLRNSSALDGEARTWACITSLGTLSQLHWSTTDSFLNPTRFDGDVFESTTTTSQHDGIHMMNSPTPII